MAWLKELPLGRVTIHEANVSNATSYLPSSRLSPKRFTASLFVANHDVNADLTRLAPSGLSYQLAVRFFSRQRSVGGAGNNVNLRIRLLVTFELQRSLQRFDGSFV